MKVFEFIWGVILLFFMTSEFVACSFLGEMWEQEVRCKNGATEYCYVEEE